MVSIEWDLWQAILNSSCLISTRHSPIDSSINAQKLFASCVASKDTLQLRSNFLSNLVSSWEDICCLQSHRLVMSQASIILKREVSKLWQSLWRHCRSNLARDRVELLFITKFFDSCISDGHGKLRGVCSSVCVPLICQGCCFTCSLRIQLDFYLLNCLETSIIDLLDFDNAAFTTVLGLSFGILLSL